MRTKIIGIICICASLLVTGAFLLSSVVRSNAASERIGQMLVDLNAGDAAVVRDAEQEEQYLKIGVETVVYESKTAGYRYTFRAEDGRLLSVRLLEKTTGPSATAIGKGYLADVAAEYVESIIGDAKIGELRQVGVRDMNAYMLYNFEEILDGVPTGTSAMAFFHYDGTPIRASFTYGTVFSLQRDGTYAITGEQTLLSEEEAIKIALNAVGEVLNEYAKPPLTMVSCELKANGEDLFYDVRFTALCDCGVEHNRSFRQRLDARTGELGSLYVSK